MKGETSWLRQTRPVFRILRDYFFAPSDLLVSGGLILLVVAMDMLGPWLVMRAIDTVVAQYEKPGDRAGIHAAFVRVLWIAGVMVAVLLAQYFARYALTRIQNRVVFLGGARLRTGLFARLQAQPLTFHTQRRVGSLLTNLLLDVQMLQDTSLALISEIPFAMCTLLGLMTMMFIINSLLACAVAAFLALVTFLALRLSRGGFRSQERAMQAADDLASRFQESLDGIRAIQSFGAGAKEQSDVEAMAGAHAREQQTAGKVHATVTPFFGLSEYAGILIVLVVGGWCALHGSLTAGGLVAFLAYMEMAADPIARIAELLPYGQKAAVAANRVDALLAQTELKPEPPGTLTPDRICGAVSAGGLGFVYPDGKVALHDLNFAAPAGEIVAVVGPNAAGKSTLLDILLKLQTPTHGSIEVDGIALRDISSECWCRLVGLVPQEIILLNRTIGENIALGSAELEDVREAARRAGVDEFIRSLPNGYDTLPGERGVRLSGGERQRIAIARAFLRDPRIVLLDEPTAALDLQGEAELLQPIGNLCSGRTSFIVSHRTALLERADKVLLLSEGRQLAFDTPYNVWRAFPGYRPLFPLAWNREPAARHVSAGPKYTVS